MWEGGNAEAGRKERKKLLPTRPSLPQAKQFSFINAVGQKMEWIGTKLGSTSSGFVLISFPTNSSKRFQFHPAPELPDRTISPELPSFRISNTTKSRKQEPTLPEVRATANSNYSSLHPLQIQSEKHE
jgi:hypothetical protein